MNASGRPLAVYFDDQVFSIHSGGGISRYFVELMRTFRDHSEFGVQIAGHRMWTRNDYVVESGFGRRLPLSPRLAVYPARLLNRLTWRGGGAQIIHHTYYDRRYRGRFRDGFLRVVTVVDMIPELFPDLFPGGNPHLAKREYVDAADPVLCISESTRRDLMDVYGAPAVPTVVTPLAADDGFRPGHLRPSGFPARYVLFVGSRSLYKDFDVLGEAFAGARLPPEVALVAVGGGSFTPREESLLRSWGIERRVLQIECDDADLRGAYSNAECVVFPSRHEGFGLPTLEAMASGCPVILADSSSHVEVGGVAANFFTPGESGELGHVLESLVGNDELRLKLSA